MGAPGGDTRELVGPYRLLRKLGEGGMGAVWLARDLRLGRLVALKFLRAAHAASAGAREALVQEARTIARLSHPNVVTLHEIGESRDGRLYVVLEYVEGETLAQRTKRERLTQRESVRVARAVARAMTAAHAAGVVHRDLKPSNIVLASDGRPRVVDFGIAQRLDRSAESGEDDARDATERADDSVRGTPAYMAPEQWGDAATSASDVWALGVILFELLVGRRPLPGPEPHHYAVQANAPAPIEMPDELRARAPLLAELVARCLDKAPARRPSAGEVAEALDASELLADGGDAGVEQPFTGLLPLTERHARLFYGREPELAEALERLRAQPTLVVVGPSGTGKSSFVHAGLVPRLQQAGAWTVLRLRPGPRPFEALAIAVRAAFDREASPASPPLRASDDDTVVSVHAGGERTQPFVIAPATSSDEWARDPEGPLEDVSSWIRSASTAELARRLGSSPSFLAAALASLAGETDTEVLVCVDQLEELHTLAQDARTAEAFLRSLCGAALDAGEPVRVLLTVRDDYLGRLPWGRHAREALAGVLRLDAPGEAALREAIEAPLRVLRYDLDDPRLVAEMVRSVAGAPAALAMVQFAMSMLWARRDAGRRLLVAREYAAFGGVEGALANHADRVIDGLSPAQADLARQLLLRLVTAEGTRRAVDRAALLEGLHDDAAIVLERFLDARLLVLRSAGSTVELAHESLARMWSRLARWLEEGREDRVALSELAQAAELWAKRGRDPEALWSGAALAGAEALLARAGEPGAPVVLAFLHESRASWRRRRIRARIVRFASVAATLVTIAASITTALALQERERVAVRARERAELDRAAVLTASALTAHARGEIVDARAQLRSALEIGDSLRLRGLWDALAREPRVWRREASGVVYDAAIAPDGRSVISALQSGVIEIHDAVDLSRRTLRGHRDQVLAIDVAPDGRIVSGAWDGEARVWHADGRGGEVIHTVPGGIVGVAFSPDGGTVALGSYSSGVTLIDLASPSVRRVIARDVAQVWGVAFAPSGDRIVVVGGDGSPRLLDVSTGAELARGAPGGAALSMALHAGGERLVTGHRDGIVRLHELATMRELARWRAHEGGVRGLAFAGERLLSTALQREVREWRVPAGSLVAVHDTTFEVLTVATDTTGRHFVLAGRDAVELRRADLLGPPPHRGQEILSVAFDPRGERIVTGSGASLYVWDVQSGERSARIPVEGARRVAFDATGERIVATESGAGRVGVWDRATGQRLVTIDVGDTVIGMEHDPARGEVVTSTGNGLLRVHELATGRLVRELRGHRAQVRHVALGASGAIYSSSVDGTVRRWDRDTGSSALVLETTVPLLGLGVDTDEQTLVVGSGEGTVTRVDLLTGERRVLATLPGRVYDVRFEPSGEHVVVGCSDGRAYVLGTRDDASAPLQLAGHGGEVNSVAFSPDGRIVVSASDDASVRTFEARTGEPVWRGVLLASEPAVVHDHRGARGLEPGSPPPPEALAAALARARHADAYAGAVCAVEGDGTLSLLDAEGTSRARWSLRPASSVRAVAGGCLVLAEGRAIVAREGEEPRTIVEGAVAIGGGASPAIATTGQVVVLDAQGLATRAVPVEGAARAVHADDVHVLVGHADGGVEVVAHDGRIVSRMRGTPRAAASRFADAIPGTIAIGFADGHVGIWHVALGDPLARGALHGRATHLAMVGDRVLAQSDLGDRAELDVRFTTMPYCELLRAVWADVRYAWSDAGAIAAPPDPSHPCAAP